MLVPSCGGFPVRHLGKLSLSFSRHLLQKRKSCDFFFVKFLSFKSRVKGLTALPVQPASSPLLKATLLVGSFDQSLQNFSFVLICLLKNVLCQIQNGVFFY